MKTTLLLALLTATACAKPPPDAPAPQMKQADVLTKAQAAMTAQFPDLVAKYQPYHAACRDGVWEVSTTIVSNVKGGGSPWAKIRDRDGKVLGVYLSR